jgi:hypothetical protein
MKKWKKYGRKRKKRTYLINILFDLEKYNEINKYRIEHSYSWTKLVSIAIKLEGSVGEK